MRQGKTWWLAPAFGNAPDAAAGVIRRRGRRWRLHTAGARWAGRPGSLRPSSRLASRPSQAQCLGRRRGTAACPGRGPRGTMSRLISSTRSFSSSHRIRAPLPYTSSKGSAFLSWWSFSLSPHRGAELIGRSRVCPAESSLRIWNTKRTRTATWPSVLSLEFPNDHPLYEERPRVPARWTTCPSRTRGALTVLQSLQCRRSRCDGTRTRDLGRDRLARPSLNSPLTPFSHVCALLRRWVADPVARARAEPGGAVARVRELAAVE